MTLTVELKTPVTGHYNQPIGLFINNEFVEGVEKKRFKCFNPSTEEVITSVCEATAKDVDIAVAAARKAFAPGSPWRSLAASDRSKLILKLADLIEANAELLAAVECLNNGKPINLTRGNVAMTAATLRYYGGWADKIMGKTVEVNPGMFNYTRLEPIGVCGQIIPWNFPLLMLSWKMGPALACGNVIVMKTAEPTPLTALLLCELVKEAGFPAGVFNCLSGFGTNAGAAIASHMDIDKVAFTGSTLTGRSIMKAAAESNLKKVTLELGGKSPNIIFNDAEIHAAARWAIQGIFLDQGQVCCAGSRIFVQEGIYDAFLASLKKQVLENKLGDGFHADTFQGPQVNKTQFERVLGYIKSGRDEGATVALGGERHGSKGYFILPTVFTDVTPDMKIAREEIFGPVCTLVKFKTEEEVIEMAHDTNFGLAAGVHTKDLSRAIRVSNALRAGTVWINCYQKILHQMSFGGFKESGIGRELGELALANYTESKSVTINLT